MDYFQLLRQQQQQRAMLVMSQSEPPPEGAFGTPISAPTLKIRRVSEPEIATADTPSYPILVSGEDASVTSSSCSSSSSCSPTSSSSSFSSDEDDDTSIQDDVTERQNSSADEKLSGAERSTSRVSMTFEDTPLKSKTNDTDGAINAQSSSFQDMFQQWHTNRVVKRRYPSVQAFPSLNSFKGFHETNTAPGGYSFGPYFDRWYAKQQERAKVSPQSSSSAPLRKRPAPSKEVSDIEKTTPASPTTRSAKKLKSHSTSSSSSTGTTSKLSIQQQRNLNSLHKWNAANALYRSKIVELPETFVPGPYTVIMGRRLKAPGCVHLRHLTDQYARRYKLGDAQQKSRIVTNILKKIYSKAPIGAFVRCKAGRYYEVEDLIAREKIVSELVAGGLQLFFPRKGMY